MKIRPGALPKNTKKGGRRPLVLSVCMKAKRAFLAVYFDFVESFKKASEKYRERNFLAPFPKGSYMPPGNTVLTT